MPEAGDLSATWRVCASTACTFLVLPPPAHIPCLQLRPYQRRSLAHMLREERAPGGGARHLWVKLNLPQQPGARAARQRSLLSHTHCQSQWACT